jgi:hypothetical protein
VRIKILDCRASLAMTRLGRRPHYHSTPAPAIARDQSLSSPIARQATIVAAENTAGVKEVHDHLCFIDSYSGFYVESPEDIKTTG